jgi:transcriptional regulator with XRE-family HTH domain
MALPPGEIDVRRRVARAVRQERARAALSQEELAEQAGLAARQVQRLEAAAVNATIGTLVRVARALGIDVRRLFDP